MRQDQHLLIQRAPTLHPEPCLVFLDPAKKGLRYPNLKSKTSLLLQLKFTVTSFHQSHQHHLSLQSVLLLVILCCSSSSLIIILHCWSSSSHHLYSSTLLLITTIGHRSAHQPCHQSCWSLSSYHTAATKIRSHASSLSTSHRHQ